MNTSNDKLEELFKFYQEIDHLDLVKGRLEVWMIELNWISWNAV